VVRFHFRAHSAPPLLRPPLAAMPVPSASPAEPRSASRRCRVPPHEGVPSPRRQLAAEAIGYLVPQTDFAGRVHSVFRQACNVASGDKLLTLAPAGADNGPATLVLDGGAGDDLRRLFAVGERIDCESGRARTRRVELRLTDARIWRPAARRPLRPTPCIDAHLRFACERLGERRRTHSSVIDRDGAPVVAALIEACRGLDGERAVQSVDRLIGWGEGLTPAGDDFLVGLCAGLAALAQRNAQRRGFLDRLGVAMIARGPRTTPIAAHYLRLAALGHHTEALLQLRDALLAEHRPERIGLTLDRALDIGATSGADTVTGLLSGLAAWLPLLPEPA